jgi:hypothetical protein
MHPGAEVYPLAQLWKIVPSTPDFVSALTIF